VAIGLATLLIVPVPFVQSLGAAGLVVPVFSLACALSLQPALLSLLGRRGFDRWSFEDSWLEETFPRDSGRASPVVSFDVHCWFS